MNISHRLTFAAALSAATVVTAGGCGQDNRPAEWPYISPAIIQPNCATTSCHSPAAAVSGLDFSTPENGYASLTILRVFLLDGGTPPAPDTTCKVLDMRGCSARPLVTPYDPAGSRVVNMLRARDAPRMPPDRPLPEADIELVERWILNGAFEHGPGPAAKDAATDASHAADASAAEAHATDANRSDASDAARDRTGG